MSILSEQFLLLAGASSIFVWLFPHCSRRYTVLLCNAAFLYLLGSKPQDWIYVLGLVSYAWLMGKLLQQHSRRWLTILACLLPAAGLCFYKYAGYFGLSGLLLPLGLSFYTFKAISYLADISAGRTAAHGIVSVFDYLVFFPTFMAGPINRAEPFFLQLQQPYVFDYRDSKNGAVQAALGLFQKLVIADELSYLVSVFLDNSQLTGWYTALGIVLYAFQLYVDFDAYSNVALGISRMMGFHLERNFHTPYLAVSIRDFWQRWHISLSSWLRDYIYIPLGGSRHGWLRKYLNTLIVFLVSGLWHGSTMMFVIWGLGHGLLNIVEDLLRRLCGVHRWMRWLSPLAVLVNFVLVSLLWVFFRASSVAEAVRILQSVLVPANAGLPWQTAGIPYNEWLWMFVLLAIVVISDLLRYHIDMIEWLCRRNILIRWAFYIAVMLTAMIFGVYGPGYNPADFIYVTF